MPDNDPKISNGGGLGRWLRLSGDVKTTTTVGNTPAPSTSSLPPKVEAKNEFDRTSGSSSDWNRTLGGDDKSSPPPQKAYDPGNPGGYPPVRGPSSWNKPESKDDDKKTGSSSGSSYSSYSSSKKDDGDDKKSDKSDDKKSEKKSSFGGSWFSSSSTAIKKLKDAPIADTAKMKSMGYAAPKDPRLFVGAQLDVKGMGTGSFVGFSSSGNAIVQINGTRAEIKDNDNLTLRPNQSFVSVMAMPYTQTGPGPRLWKPNPQQKAALDAMLTHSVGYSSKGTVGAYINAIRDAGFEAFIAGGAVRDAMVGKSARDVDLATTMWIRDVEDAVEKAGLSSGRSRTEFGTMLVGSGTSGLDVASLKGANGKFSMDLLEDIKHRDFSINALYYDPASGLVSDPTGHGVQDAQSKTLRPSKADGTPISTWLKDNPSAVVRLFKFTLRGYTATPELLQAVKDNFKSCVSSMDSFRRSRMLDSVGVGREELTKEMKRLGFTDDQVGALFPFSSKKWDDDEDSSPRLGGSSSSYRSGSSFDKSDSDKKPWERDSSSARSSTSSGSGSSSSDQKPWERDRSSGSGSSDQKPWERDRLGSSGSSVGRSYPSTGSGSSGLGSKSFEDWKLKNGLYRPDRNSDEE